MPADTSAPGPRLSPWAVLALVYGIAIVAVVWLEQASRALLAEQATHGGTLAADQVTGVHFVNGYLALRERALSGWLPVVVVIFFTPVLVLFGMKRLSAAMNRWRAKETDMEFKQARYDFPRQEAYLPDFIRQNTHPLQRVFLGLTPDGTPHYLTDKERETHVHILGQTGSGKTKGAIEPLLFQDLWRGRGVLLVDAKGAQENEDRFAAMAASCGRLAQLKVFTLNRLRPSHTYNPLHLVSDADPRAVAERVFSSFMEDMDNPYYRDQARMFFVTLIGALAGTGERFHMQDVAAAIASPEVLAYALRQTSDSAARRELHAQLKSLGRKAGETFTGLLAAVKRYDHPAINVYDPDIVLEREIDTCGAVAFFLPVNYYKQLARYVGLIVFQHLQQLGALRQLDRSRPQTPLYVYADEFYSFAYEGFTDAVNKLRDARISIHLAHQSISDLEKVSPEFAAGIWDNTRTKIVLLQTNPELCERIAKTLGTRKNIEMTVRRSTDEFLNKVNMGEASTKEVDEYRLHPSRVKMLQTFQAYVTQDAAFVPLNLQILPELPGATPPPPKPRDENGLNLHRLFVEGKIVAEEVS